MDDTLFQRITHNSYHTIHHLLPAWCELVYNIRQRSHDRQLTIINGQLRNRNFINRMLFKDCYWLCCIFTCIIHLSTYFLGTTERTSCCILVLCYFYWLLFYFYYRRVYSLVFLQMRSVILLNKRIWWWWWSRSFIHQMPFLSPNQQCQNRKDKKHNVSI